MSILKQSKTVSKIVEDTDFQLIMEDLIKDCNQGCAAASQGLYEIKLVVGGRKAQIFITVTTEDDEFVQGIKKLKP